MMYCTKLVVLACVIRHIGGFSLYDEQASYVEFEKWSPVDNLTSLVFRFKTYANAGLLLYVDDGGFAQYLTLYLRAGFLVVEVYDGRRTYKDSSGTAVNGLTWHKVDVLLTSRHVEFWIDGQSFADYTTRLLTFRSKVYFGGFPRSMSIADVASFEAGFLPRFLGCVKDVRYGSNSTNRTAIMVDSEGLGDECGDACKPENPCQNNGVCINRFALAKCVCIGTGYMGKTCQNELPVIGIPTRHDRVIVDMPSTVVANLDRTSLLIRFRTAQPDGMLFYTAEKGDYILLEVTSGNVATTVNLGSGSVTIATKNGAYDDNRWHTVRLDRFERMVNLTVDSGTTFTDYTKGNFTGFSSESSGRKMTIYLGGATGTHLNKKSVSRQNFTGCLQELVFNQYDIFSKLNTGTSQVRSRSTILSKCPEVPTKTVMVPTSNAPGTTSPPKTPLPDHNPKSEPDSTNNSTDITTSNPISYVPSCPPNINCVSTEPTHISSGNTARTTFGPFRTDDKTRSIDASDSSENTRTTIPTYSEDRSEHVSMNTGPTREIQDFSENGNGVVITLPSQPTDHVIMATDDIPGPTEGDLTLWFVLAAGVGVLAFVMVLVVIIKVHAAGRKKYEIRESKIALHHYSSGSFQRSPKKSSKNPV